MKKMSIIIQFVILGFAFGLLFPIVAILIDLNIKSLSFTLSNILFIHAVNPLNYIIDMAPFVISMVAYLVGKIVYNKIIILNNTIEIQLVELEDRNEELVTLNDSIMQQKNIIDEKEKRLSTIIQNMGEGFGIVDNNNIYTFNNQSLERIFEVEPGGLIGKKMSYFYPENTIDKLLANAKEISAESIRSYEVEITSAKSNKKWVSVTITNDFDDSNNIIGRIGIVRDISTSKKAEKIISEQNKKLQILINNLPVFIYFKDSSFRYQLVNSTFANVFGSPVSDLIGKTDIELAHEEAEIYAEFDKQVVETKKPLLNLESIYKDKNGIEFWASTSKVPYLDDEGNVIGIIGIVQDITHLKKSEQALKESEEKYRIIAENTKDNIWKINLSTFRFSYISPSVFAMRGFTVEEAIKQSIEESLIPDSYNRALKDINESIKKAEDDKNISISRQYQQYCKNGKIIDIEMIATFIYDDKGKPIEITGITRDITERVKIEKELNTLYAIQKQSLKLEKHQKQIIEENLYQKNILVEELEKIKSELEIQLVEKDKFFSILAHDLKNPFTGFLGLSSFLAEESQELPNDEIMRISMTLNSGAKQLFNLLENLLEWSRIKTELMDLNPLQIDLKYMINNIVKLFKDNCIQKRIEIIKEFDTEFHGFADSYSINMVIRNLLSNAIKFSFPESKIIVKLADYSTDYLLISIQDFGTGMSEEDLLKLFRLDVKFTNLGTQKEKGTGLGLLLCKEYIEKSGGTICVESKLNEGTCFSFTIVKYNGQEYKKIG